MMTGFARAQGGKVQAARSESDFAEVQAWFDAAPETVEG
jgi:hypothetical protein